MSSVSAIIQRVKDSDDIDSSIFNLVESVATSLNDTLKKHEERLSLLESDLINKSAIIDSIQERIDDDGGTSNDDDVEFDFSYYYHQTVERLDTLENFIKSVICNQNNSVHSTVMDSFQSSISKNDLRGVKILKPFIKDIDSQFNDGINGIQLSLRLKHFKITHFLLDNDSTLNISDYSSSPIEIQQFLSKELEARKPSPFNEDIRYACEKGDLLSVKYLVQFCNGDIESKDENGCTLLQIASEHGSLNVVKYLIDKGADIEAKNIDGYTPLYTACRYGKLDVVRYLIDKDADIESKDNNGCSPLYTASEHGYIDVVKYLIDKGADIEAISNNKCTSLQTAVSNGYLDIVKYLIDRGANTEAKDNNGCTLLHLASYRGALNIVNFLIDQGANIEAKDNDGWTPLYGACRHNKEDIVNYLIDKGANIEAKDNNGNTPLHTACRHGKLDIVKCLIDKDADIESKGNKGYTPLHSACSNGKLEVVKYLIEKGSNIEANTDNGCTPYNVSNWRVKVFLQPLISK